MLVNGDLLGSDAIIFDLEDAVAPDDKDSAAILVAKAMEFFKYKKPVLIRINGTDTEYWENDLETVVPRGPDFILLPKASSPDEVRLVADKIEKIEKACGSGKRTNIIGLVETAYGIRNVYETAASHERLKGICIGAEDLTADLHSERTKAGDEISYSRGQIVAAARAAGIDCYDTPFTAIDDYEGVAEDARLARRLGFTGKLIISPRHVPYVNEVFSPTEDEIAYAKEVMEIIEDAKRNGRGAVSLNGKMIDKPIVERARQVLELAVISEVSHG